MIVYGFWFYQELVNMIGVGPGRHQGDHEDSYIVLDTPAETFEVKVTSLRMDLFKKNPKCVTCYRTGALWILEAHRRNENPHLNLYHVEDKVCEEWKNLAKDGLVMMTKDHIIPKSAGGPTSLENLQTMCSICNGKKGQKLMHQLPDHERKAIVQRQGKEFIEAEMKCLGGIAHYL